MTKLVSAMLAFAFTVSAAVPVSQEVWKNGITVSVSPVAQGPHSDAWYTGGAGVFVRLVSAKFGYERIRVTIAARLKDGSVVTATESTRHRALSPIHLYFRIGEVSSIEAVSVEESPAPESTTF